MSAVEIKLESRVKERFCTVLRKLRRTAKMLYPFVSFLAVALIGSVFDIVDGYPHGPGHERQKVRTVITTDMEQDDLASLIRYMLYTNDIDTQGIIYSASRFHWSGDGKNTTFYLPGREYNTSQTSWRWTGTRTIEDKVLAAYAEVYDNLIQHDPSYPTPEDLLSITKIGNIDFEGEMEHDTDGSNLIRSLLLDHDPRPIYLQAWGGTNTIARALKSLEEMYLNTTHWPSINATVSKKAVIMASGFQDNTYAEYIAPRWPQIRVETLSAPATYFGYNCNRTGLGNTDGLPDYNKYFTAPFIKNHIQIGPLGSLYRSWLDGQHMPGDQLDGFGNLNTTAVDAAWCPPITIPYSHLGEGDDICYFPLLHTGIEVPEDPRLGSWGGRGMLNSSWPEFWTSVTSDRSSSGEVSGIADYTSYRWIPAVQNDFAARMGWTLTSDYGDGNHHPEVEILEGGRVRAKSGEKVELMALVSDPDGDEVEVSWWQYFEEGTYTGTVEIEAKGKKAVVKVPAGAEKGQTISIILQGTDDGEFPLTRYDRVFVEVV